MPKYVMNVALDGRHYCRIELPDVRLNEVLGKVRSISKALGPEFDCSLTRWATSGYQVEIWEDA